jgi:AraC-like DNA-binding protein
LIFIDKTIINNINSNKEYNDFIEILKECEKSENLQPIEEKILKNFMTFFDFAWNEKFKEITSKTPIEYKNFLKTQRAVELLLTDEYTIREIAELLDFPDEYYFSKIFKRFWGESPKKFYQHYYTK